MNAHDMLSDDGRAIVTLCSELGRTSAPECEPYKLAEWNQLARKIHASPFQRPAALSAHSASELAEGLQVTTQEGERIAKLMDRGGQIAIELEQLFSRGMWVMSRIDEHYPPQLRQALKHQAPTILFGAGEVRLLQRKGIAIVGSRNIDTDALTFAGAAGRKIAQSGLAVVSGGAKGSDRVGMDGGLSADGVVIGVLPDSLERTVRQPEIRRYLLDDRLVFLTPYNPDAGFSVGGAMGRNKIIYGMSEFALVVSSDFEKGGTWAGAVEALKNQWCPVFVRQGGNVPKGNLELIRKGATAMSHKDLEETDDLKGWLEEHKTTSKAEEQKLFKF